MWHPKHYPLLVLFLLSAATCALPFLYRIPLRESYLLVAIAAPVLALQIALMIRTTAAAHGSKSRRILIRKRAGWHMAANGLKIGLALALMQQYSAMSQQMSRVSCQYQQPTFYVLCYQPLTNYRHQPTRLPRIRKVVPAIAGLVMIGAAEAGLCIAIGISRKRTITAIAFRGAVIMLAAGAFLAVDDYVYHLIQLNNKLVMSDSYFNRLNRQEEAWLLQTMITGAAVLAEGGLLAAANMLRPYEPSGFHMLQTACSIMLGCVLLAAVAVLHLKRYPSDPAKRISLLAVLQQTLHLRILRHSLRRPSTRAGMTFGLLVMVVAAQIPLLIYVDTTRISLLVFLVALALTAQVAVTIYSFQTANHYLKGNSRATFDLLRLTTIDRGRLLFTLWWTILRQTWLMYLMLALIRQGAAYGVMQYLNAMPFAYDIPDIGRAFSYISYNNYVGLNPQYPALHPHPAQMILATINIGILTLTEMGMVTAVGLMVNLLASRIRVPALLVRLLPVVLCLCFMLLTAAVNDLLLRNTFNAWERRNGEIISYESRQWLRILEHFQVTASTLIDGGIMAGANLLRPKYLRVYYVVDTLLSFGWGVMVNLLITVAALRAAAKAQE
jgi:hypothetical protein